MRVRVERSLYEGNLGLFHVDFSSVGAAVEVMAWMTSSG